MVPDNDDNRVLSCKTWSAASLKGDGFHDTRRVSVKDLSHDEISRYVVEVERNGVPLVLTDWHQREEWDAGLLNLDWVLKNMNDEIEARDVTTREDVRMPFGSFVDICRAASPYATKGEGRLYAKDLSCPEEWERWLQRLPSPLLPGGSNDLIKNLPAEDRPENLMCYIGIGDTLTPLHKDLCGSIGQNLMCWSENGGSAFWFMTAMEHADTVCAFFRRRGKEVDLETHLSPLDELAALPCPVYFCEQTLGDLIIVPSRSCHQVVNQGGITFKISWSRMTLSCIDRAINQELPVYRRVCREEVYRVKQMLFRTIHEITKSASPSSPKLHPTVLTQMLQLLDQVLVEEYAPLQDQFRHFAETPNIRCDFCGADCFISFFHCQNCLEGTVPQGLHNPGVAVCSGCYVEGRSCRCGTMEPVQLRPFAEVVAVRDQLAALVGEEPFAICGKVEDNSLLRTFSAAWALKCMRSDYKNKLMNMTRRCSPNQRQASGNTDAHTIDISAGVPCRDCHRILCFRHILDLQLIHPSEAILMRAGDLANPDNQQWHEFHKASKKVYRHARNGLEGPGPNPYVTATWAALTFNRCQPVTTKVKLGWFDGSNEDNLASLLPPHHKRTPIREVDTLASPVSSDEDHDWTPRGPRQKRKPSMTSALPRKKRKSTTNMSPVSKVEFQQFSDGGPPGSGPGLELVGQSSKDVAFNMLTTDQNPHLTQSDSIIYGLIKRKLDEQMEKIQEVVMKVEGLLGEQNMRIEELERRLADRDANCSELGSPATQDSSSAHFGSTVSPPSSAT